MGRSMADDGVNRSSLKWVWYRISSGQWLLRRWRSVWGATSATMDLGYVSV